MADLNAGILAPVHDEVVITDLHVSGRIPPDLKGALLRNGPNPHRGRFEGDDMLSWWVAAAMVHGIAIADGRAEWYRNRWVRTGDWMRRFEPAAELAPDLDHNPNVNVIWHSGRTLALGEGGLPFEIDADLATAGPFTFGGALPGGMTAHPKIDAATGELVYFRADWQPPFLRYGVLDAQDAATTSQVIEVDEPAMMHDFAITENHSILLDLNVGYDFSMFAHGAAIPLRWSDDRQSRLGVMRRHGGDVRWFAIDKCFVQHVLNAYEPDDATIVLDAVRYPDFLRFDAEQAAFEPNPLGVLWRYRIDLVSGHVTETQLADHHVEFPIVDPRRVGLRHRYAYLVEQPTDVEMRGLLKVDLSTGAVERHAIPEGDQNSESVFVPRSGSAGADDDGWLLSCIYRAATDSTDVTILDAADVAAEPVATIHLPRRIPAGFHGTWVAR